VARGSYGCASAAVSGFEDFTMRPRKSPGAVAALGASVADQLGRQVIQENKRQQQFAQPPIRATLVGSDRCEAEGISARGYSSVLDLCRELVAAGLHPASPLEAWRREILCLRVRSIGEGARLTVADDRHGTPRLRRWRKRPQGYGAGSPVAQNANGREVATPAQPTTSITAMHNPTTTGMATAATSGTAAAAANMPATTATSGMTATAAFRESGGVGQPVTQETAP
jgi:hypothetical protein